MTRLFIVVGFLLSLGARAGDPPTVHGMLLFGMERIYLSHLPMFHSPHDYQMILEVTLPAEARDTYLKDRRENPSETVYTFVPKPFVLPDLKTKPFALQGAVFRGHFERGGTEIIPSIKTGVPKIVFFKKLNGDEKAPSSPTYLLLGIADELFMAHLITGRPNFDHIARIHIAGSPSPIPDGKDFVTISIPEEKGDKPVEQVFRTSISVLETGASRFLSQLETLYLEKDELK